MADQQAVSTTVHWETPTKNQFYISPLLLKGIDSVGGGEDKQLHVKFWRAETYKEKFEGFNGHYFSF